MATIRRARAKLRLRPAPPVRPPPEPPRRPTPRHTRRRRIRTATATAAMTLFTPKTALPHPADRLAAQLGRAATTARTARPRPLRQPPLTPAQRAPSPPARRRPMHIATATDVMTLSTRKAALLAPAARSAARWATAVTIARMVRTARRRPPRPQQRQAPAARVQRRRAAVPVTAAKRRSKKIGPPFESRARSPQLSTSKPARWKRSPIRSEKPGKVSQVSWSAAARPRRSARS